MSTVATPTRASFQALPAEILLQILCSLLDEHLWRAMRLDRRARTFAMKLMWRGFTSIYNLLSNRTGKIKPQIQAGSEYIETLDMSDADSQIAREPHHLNKLLDAKFSRTHTLRGYEIEETNTQAFKLLRHIASAAPVKELMLLAAGRTNNEFRTVLGLFKDFERLTMNISRHCLVPDPAPNDLPWGHLLHVQMERDDERFLMPNKLVLTSLARCPTLVHAVFTEMPSLRDFRGRVAEPVAPFFPALESLETVANSGGAVRSISRMHNLKRLHLRVSLLRGGKG
ncbi:hypothetical protein CSOJ01_16091, partial [Colletotrichum sojae]